MADNVEQPSEIGKAANRLMALRMEAEKRVSSASETSAKAEISEHNEIIRSSIERMSSQIIDVLKPLVAISTDIKATLEMIQRSSQKTVDQIKFLDETVGNLNTNMSTNLGDLLNSQREMLKAMSADNDAIETRLDNLNTTMESALSVLDDLATAIKQQNYSNRDQQEFSDHAAALQARRRRRGIDDTQTSDHSGFMGERDKKKGILSKMTGAIGGITNWFSSFLGIGGAVGGGMLGGALGRLFVGAGTMFVGLVKFGVIGALAAIAATGLMSIIYSTREKLKKQGVTEASDQIIGIAKELWVGLVEVARSVVGSTLNLLSRIPKVGGIFSAIEEEVNHMADWLTDFSKTNKDELAKAEAQINTATEDMNKSLQAVQETESQLSVLYRQRRRAESENNVERLAMLNQEISRMENLRDQQKAEANRATEAYDKLAKKIAKEKLGGIAKLWDNYVVPSWDKLTGAASSLWSWMGGAWETITKKWEGFSDFWLNLGDDISTKVDQLKSKITGLFSGDAMKTLENLGQSAKSMVDSIISNSEQKIIDLGNLIKNAFLSLFDLKAWKERLQGLAPSNWFSPENKATPPATVTPEQQPQVTPPVPKPAPRPFKEPAPKPSQIAIAPEAFKSFLSMSPVASLPAPVNDNHKQESQANSSTSVAGSSSIEIRRDPVKIDTRVERIDGLMRDIATRRQESAAKMFANVTQVVAPHNVSVVNTTHNTMAVSPRPISHPTMNMLSKAAGWG